MTGPSPIPPSEPRPSLGEVLHEARVAGGEARPRPWPPEDWADRDPRLRDLDEKMAAAVEARVRADIAADFKRLAADLKPHPLVPPGVPGIERRVRQDTWRAAAVVAVNGLSPKGRDDEKEAGP